MDGWMTSLIAELRLQYLYMQYVNQLNAMVRSSPPSWTVWSVSTHESKIPYSINGQSLDPKKKTRDRSTIDVNQRWSGKGRKGSKAQIFEERDNRRTQTQKPQLSLTGADRLWVLCEIRRQQKKLQCPHLRKRVKLYSSPFTEDTKKLNWALFFQWWLAGQDIFHQVPTRWH